MLRICWRLRHPELIDIIEIFCVHKVLNINFYFSACLMFISNRFCIFQALLYEKPLKIPLSQAFVCAKLPKLCLLTITTSDRLLHQKIQTICIQNPQKHTKPTKAYKAHKTTLYLLNHQFFTLKQRKTLVSFKFSKKIGVTHFTPHCKKWHTTKNRQNLKKIFAPILTLAFVGSSFV